MELSEDLAQGQVDEARVFCASVDENAAGGVATKFTKANFHGTVWQLVKDRFPRNLVAGPRDARWGELSP